MYPEMSSRYTEPYRAYPSPSTACYSPILFTRNLFDWPLRLGVAAWTYCSECGRRRPRDQQLSGPDAQFQCPATVVTICKRDKNHTFRTGCRYDCYRQRDLETNGVHSMTANQSTLDWRREHRQLWGLELDPTRYDICSNTEAGLACL